MRGQETRRDKMERKREAEKTKEGEIKWEKTGIGESKESWGKARRGNRSEKIVEDTREEEMRQRKEGD